MQKLAFLGIGNRSDLRFGQGIEPKETFGWGDPMPMMSPVSPQPDRR
jgi:hypothetical protein